MSLEISFRKSLLSIVGRREGNVNVSIRFCAYICTLSPIRGDRPMITLTF